MVPKNARKIVRLGGVRQSPQTVLASTLEKAPRIKSVVLGIEWDDGAWDLDYSSVAMSQLSFVAALLLAEAVEGSLPLVDADD